MIKRGGGNCRSGAQRGNCYSRESPVVGAERADAGFDFEHGDSLVEELRRQDGLFHDSFAVVGAAIERLEDGGFLGCVAEEVLLGELALMFDKIVGEKDAQKVVELSVRGGALSDQAVAALRIGSVDVAGDGEDLFALFEAVQGGVEGAGVAGGFGDDDGVREAGDQAVAVEERALEIDTAMTVGREVFAGGEREAVWGKLGASRDGNRAGGTLDEDFTAGGIGWIFAENGTAMGEDFGGELEMTGGVDLVDRGAENGNGGAAGVKTGAVGDRVDAVGKAGNNDDAALGELVGEAIGNFFAVFGVAARADDCDAFGHILWQFSIEIQCFRRKRNGA